MLDLGSGMGHWAEFFSRRFANVGAIEASLPLFEALKRRRRWRDVLALLNAHYNAGEPGQPQVEGLERSARR